MKGIKIILLLVLACFSSYLMGEEDSSYIKLVAEGSNRMGFDFYHTLRQQSGNFCYSPYSISSGLALMAAGAKGETANKLQLALHYSAGLLPLNGDMGALLQKKQILMANTLCVEQELPLLRPFKLTIEHELRGNLQLLNFKEINQVVQTVNHWASQQTKGKISFLINSQDITPQTKILLATSLTLKGEWTQPFNQKETQRAPFQLTPQRTTMVEMMHLTAPFLVSKGELADLIVLPYSTPQLAMALLLPKKELGDLEANFTWENWQKWLPQGQMQAVALSLPRFRVESRFDLNSSLSDLHLASLFHPDANLTAMSETRGIFLNKAIHKAVIKIDEKGSDGEVSKSVNPSKIEGTPYSLTIDRPFVFVVWDQKTSLILLMGRVTLP